MTELEVGSGEYWEGLPWKLIIPYESDSTGADTLCPHAVLVGEPVPKRRVDGSVYGHTQRFMLPKGLVECKNEAGNNGTGLCLECLDEARGAFTP